MKGYLVFVVVVLLMPIGLFNPFFGMMFYNWFALFKPEWWYCCYPHNVRSALFVAILTFIGWIVSTERKLPPIDATTILIVLLLSWMGITTYFALDPGLAWTHYSDMINILLFSLVMYSMLTTPQRAGAISRDQRAGARAWRDLRGQPIVVPRGTDKAAGLIRD